MRLLHFSDIHIGMENYGKLDPKSGLSTRLLDFFQTFDFIVELAIKEGVDAVVFAGDAYKTRDPNPTQQRGFGERIKRLAKRGIPTILVVGNHDTPNAEGKANSLDIYSALEIENVWVSRNPEYLEIPTKSGTLQVITLPWLHKNDYRTIAERLRLLLGKVKLSATDGPAILVSHCEVEGASFGSEKGLAIGSDVTIPLPLLQDKRLNYVALGHIHKHQVLGKNPLIVYSGSPQRIDFGEEKEAKGVILVEITPAVPAKGGNYKNGSPIKSGGMTSFDATFEFIPTNARRFLTIDITLEKGDTNPTKTILDEIAKYEIAQAIVRLTIKIPMDLDESIKMDEIKKTLKEAHFIAGISRNVERKHRIVLEGTSDVERLTPVLALGKYFQAKKYSPEKIKELEKFACLILES